MDCVTEIGVIWPAVVASCSPVVGVVEAGVAANAAHARLNEMMDMPLMLIAFSF